MKSVGAFNSDQGDLHSARASTSKHRQPEGDPDAGCREEQEQDNGFLNSDNSGGKALPDIRISHDGPQEVHGWRCLKVRITFERRFM